VKLTTTAEANYTDGTVSDGPILQTLLSQCDVSLLATIRCQLLN